MSQRRLPAVPAWYPQTRAVVAMRGPDAVDLLHRLCTQDVRALRQLGTSCRGLLVSAQGKLLHAFDAWRAADAVHLATASGSGAALVAHLARYTIVEQVDYAVLGEAVPAAWVHGGASKGDWQVLEGTARTAKSGQGEAPPCTWLPGPPGLAPGVLVLASHGAPAPDGPTALAATCAQQIAGPLPAPLSFAAWCYLRARAGVPAADEDYAAGAMPLEFRLGASAVSWNKGCYVGQEVLSRLDSYRKVARLLMGFAAPAAAAPALFAAGGELRVWQSGRPIGRVTGWAQGEGAWPAHPAGEGPHVLGLALVKAGAAVDGTAVHLGAAASSDGVAATGEAAKGADTATAAATVAATLHDCRAWA